MEIASATDTNRKTGEAPNSTPSGSRMKRGFSQPAKWNDTTMKVLVTGSAGHLGEALVRTLQDLRYEVVGLDILASPFTTHAGSIADRGFVQQCMKGVKAVFHAATLHKPHVATHRRQEFVDTNITGTLNLLEEAVAARVESFVYTSTTSVFGDALVPPQGAPAAWITEEVAPAPKNIYGVSKAAAEDLCELFHRNQNLACIVLRTSRFFPEEDDSVQVRNTYSDANAKANEFLYRRVDMEDVVSAHLLAAQQAGCDRVPEVHHQCDHSLSPQRSGGAAGRRSASRGAAGSRV